MHHAWKGYLKTNSYERYQTYRKKTNLLKKDTRKAKRFYEKKLAKESRHDNRGFVRYVNSKRCRL